MLLQRKLPGDPTLSFPTSVMTSIQVHILNPVDIMRAVLDEGVVRLTFFVNNAHCSFLGAEIASRWL